MSGQNPKLPPLVSPSTPGVRRWSGNWHNVRPQTHALMEVQDGSTVIGTRRKLRFLGATGNITEVPAEDLIEIDLAGLAGGTDEKVKVTSNDTTADYLFNKLAAGAGIGITELNNGANEDAQIAIDDDDIPYTPGTLGDWNSSADPGDVDDALDQLASRIKAAEVATRTLALTAQGGAPTTTSGCADVEKRELATNDVDIWFLAFDQTVAESAFWQVPMPDNYGGGTLVPTFYWTAPSGSGGVVWGIKGRSFANDEALDQAYGTEIETADTLLAANDVHTVTGSAMTLSGTPAGGEFVQFKVTRKVAHASDTLAADAQLLAVRLEYVTNAVSD